MSLTRRLAVPICALLALFAGEPSMAAPVRDCDGTDVTVEAVSRGDADLACTAAGAAIPDFSALGLTQRAPIRITVTDALEHASGICAAIYNAKEGEIQVLTTACLEDLPARATIFSDLPATVLFQSLIVHELTHALIDQVPKKRPVPRIAQEYLAYAIQLDSLPDAGRRRILEATHVPHPPDIARINSGMLNIAPLYFAAASWLFFTANGGDAAHVKAVLDGDLLFDSMME